MKRSPLFITLEGGEGAGKTTLIEAIFHQLMGEGCSAIKTREPGGTAFAEVIRRLLLEKRDDPLSPYAELCLFLAARAQHVRDVILPALREEKIVLCDRFHDSTIVYQGIARGLGASAVANFSHFVTEGLQPNLTLYLDIDPVQGLKRAAARQKHDRIESETLLFHQKIRSGYRALAAKEPCRICTLDASQPPHLVLEQAMEKIHAYRPLA
jgi:dTMP kinase